MLEQTRLASRWLTLGLTSIKDGSSLLLSEADLCHLTQGRFVGLLLHLWVLKNGNLISNIAEVGLKACTVLLGELRCFAGSKGLSLSLCLLLRGSFNASNGVFDFVGCCNWSWCGLNLSRGLRWDNIVNLNVEVGR